MKATVRLIVIAAVALAAGLWIGKSGSGGGEAQPEHSAPAAARAPAQATEYTCSMHPQVRQPEPGKCPICAMDLIPVTSGNNPDSAKPELMLSKAAAELAEVETAPAERRYVDVRVRMVGTLMSDETRMGRITAWVPGRIDKLFVNYTGIAVNKGDHMAEIYSPQLLTVQHELIMAAKEPKSEVLGNLRKSARERLRLWGVTADQIDAIEHRDKATDNMTILAPMSGIVLEKNVVEGQYVDTGTTLFRIADLSKLWLHLDAYESDLQWLRYGQTVDFTVAAWPGKTFQGVVSFIDPMLDDRTRTTKVRVVVDNSAGRLKPGMFARAVVEAQVTDGGKVRNPSLEGKWICPMHPEVVKDGPGKCDVCGMALLPASELGYATEDNAPQPPLVIPDTAPLITGTRAVVYVVANAKDRVYEGREIALGPHAGKWYVVESGLEEGEQVVTRGNFKIDSALQIQARPSMMSPAQTPVAEEKTEPPSEKPKPFDNVSKSIRDAVDTILAAYFPIADALAADDLTSAAAHAAILARTIDAAPHGPMGADAHVFWMRERTAMESAAEAMAAEKENIGSARTSFKTLSDALQRTVRRLGATGAQPAMVFFCPMAFDNRGAEWLQNHEGVLNPYFGAQMLTCGEMRDKLTPGD